MRARRRWWSSGLALALLALPAACASEPDGLGDDPVTRAQRLAEPDPPTMQSPQQPAQRRPQFHPQRSSQQDPQDPPPDAVGVDVPVGPDQSSTGESRSAPGPAVAGAQPPSGPPSHRGPLARPHGRIVLAVSVDGLNPAALRTLGPERTPTLHRLFAEGAGTRNARTAREQTVTLPNHTGMLTGRRIDPKRGGHGVTWNTHVSGSTVQKGAGHPVASVFTAVRRAGGTTALFSTKDAFSLFERSWDRGIQRFLVDGNQGELVDAARRDLLRKRRTLTFLHLSATDYAGHHSGFLSPDYLEALAWTDAQLGSILDAAADRPALRRRLTVVLTADHGGASGATSHSTATTRANYRVPFVVWGPGIGRADLYALNRDYRAPGKRRTTYGGKQPVRNADLANVVTGLLGIDPVPGSRFGRGATLDVTRR